MRFKDLSGQKFGMLTVIKRIENKGRRVCYLCGCDCGGTSEVTALNLSTGNSESCGCQKFKGRKSVTNEYYKEDGYMVGVTQRGKKFIFDAEDFELVKQYCWSSHTEGYLDAKERKTGRSIRLHRLIMGVDKGFDVDHINHDTSDNRKCNLRIVTRSQNNMNVRLQKNSTSKVTGVVFDKARNKYKAQIGVNYKNIVLGRFDTIEEAIQARKDAEKKYFGEHAYNEEVNRVEY